MSTMQTLREPKAQRLRSDPVPQNIVEEDKSEPYLTPHKRWCLEQDAKLVMEGQTGEPLLTLKEIVAICKEARAEVYAEEQERKKAAGR